MTVTCGFDLSCPPPRDRPLGVWSSKTEPGSIAIPDAKQHAHRLRRLKWESETNKNTTVWIAQRWALSWKQVRHRVPAGSNQWEDQATSGGTRASRERRREVPRGDRVGRSEVQESY